jgi:hypothetical protein
VPTELDVISGVPIVDELAKLIKLSGKGSPTTVEKFRSDADRQRMTVYMSWDSNGELQIK